MKLLRALIALVLIASMSTTGLAAAQPYAPASQSAGVDLPQLPDSGAPSVSPPAAPGGLVAPSSSDTDSVPADTGDVIVTFETSVSPAVVSAIAKSADTSAGTVEQVVPGTVTWEAPKGRSTAEFAEQLEKNGHVKSAAPNFIRHVLFAPQDFVAPSDPAYTEDYTGWRYSINRAGTKVYTAQYPRDRSWWLRDINAETAWRQGYKANIVGQYPLRASGGDFTVAVIDTGLYSEHPDAGNIVPGHDFIDDDNDVAPDEAVGALEAAHGTCVAGQIAATPNHIGTIGVGYDTRVVVHKVQGSLPGGDFGITDKAVIDAIDWSVRVDHAKVINMSFGGPEYSRPLADKIIWAYDQGVVLVAAKGNESSGRKLYPGCNAHVISVGALDKNVKAATIPAAYSNYSTTKLDIMAPGSFIWGLTKSDYYIWDGTSMASPVVAGALAWLWRAAPALSNAEITSEVLGSAPKGPASSRYPSGYRKLDMASAYSHLKADYPLLTKPVLHEQTVASLGSVPVTWGMQITKLRAVTYSWSMDTTLTGQTASPGMVFRDLMPGDHVVDVQANSSYNWDDGTAQSETLVHVVPSADGTTTWLGAHVAGSSATLATPSYRKTTTIDATLHDASGTALSGGTVKLQYSTDNAHYADAPGGVVTNLQSGVYRSAAAPTSRRWYRFAFAGSGGVLRSVSAPLRITPGVSLTTPATKSSISHTSKLSVTGKLMPSHSTSSRVVKLKIKRWNGHRWADYSSIWTRVTRRNSTYAVYAVQFKLKKGGYRLYAYAPADAQHSTTTSGYRSVTVK